MWSLASGWEFPIGPVRVPQSRLSNLKAFIKRGPEQRDITSLQYPVTQGKKTDYYNLRQTWGRQCRMFFFKFNKKQTLFHMIQFAVSY